MSTNAGAWSAAGHRDMGRSVFKALSPKEKVYFASLAIRLNYQDKKTPKIRQRVSVDEKFADLSIIADNRRGLMLEEVFREFGETLPDALGHYAKEKTANWHYHNEIKSAGRAEECNFHNRGELLGALRALDSALAGDLRKRQKALVLAFSMHLIQDLHQPLHTFTKLDSQCKSDRGGNATCYRRNLIGSSCKRNLHAEWDRGFGAFKGPTLSYKGEESALNFAPEVWIKEGLLAYDFVYDMDNKNYRDEAKKIIEAKRSLAHARLLNYLKAHYRAKARK